MLSGIGVTELLLLFVIGLLILGPERLPRVASQLGRWVGKARRTANQLRFQMEREIALADIERTQSKKREEESKSKSAESAGKSSPSDRGDNAAADGASAGGAGPDSAKSAATGPAPGAADAGAAEKTQGTQEHASADREK